MIASISEEKVLDACRTLFGSSVSLSRDFLFYLQPTGARSAFRKVAKESHPDRFANEHPSVQKQQTSQFREILTAYELLNAFFKQREEGLWMPADDLSGPDAPARPKERGAGRAHTYSGPVPLRRLEIGLYLYYCGAISHQQLIEALVWQRGQRPVVGTIARQWKWLDGEAVRSILTLRGRPLRFGEKAVHLGLLSPFNVNALLWFQRSRQERLGQFFVQQGHITAGEMERLAGELLRHNARVRKGP